MTVLATSPTRQDAEPRVQPSPLRWWVEWPILGALYAVFEVLRAHIHPHAGPALAHAKQVVTVERWTWLLHEARLNAWLDAHKTLSQAANIYYGTVHFAGPPLLLIWLWRWHPEKYRRWVVSLIVLTVVGLVVFAAWPLAPPRLTPPTAHAHFVDTNRWGGMGPFDRGNFKDSNPFAAMPSLHVAWSTWCALVVIAVGITRRRWLVLLYPAVTLLVVVGTANHWVLDAVGAWMCVAIGLAVGSFWVTKRGTREGATGMEEVRTHGERGAPQ